MRHNDYGEVVDENRSLRRKIQQLEEKIHTLEEILKQMTDCCKVGINLIQRD